MRTFFDEHAPDRKDEGQSGAAKPRAETEEDDVVCEEILLEAFSR